MLMTLEIPLSDSGLEQLEFSPDGTQAAVEDAKSRLFLISTAQTPGRSE